MAVRYEIIAKLRAVAIGELIKSASDAFLRNEGSLLDGTFSAELISDTPYAADIANAKNLAKKKIYWSERKTKIEIAGSEIISGLLDFFRPVVEELEQEHWNATKLIGRSEKLARLFSGFNGVRSRYEAWLRVTDFVSGMTDRYALELYPRRDALPRNVTCKTNPSSSIQPKRDDFLWQ